MSVLRTFSEFVLLVPLIQLQLLDSGEYFQRSDNSPILPLVAYPIPPYTQKLPWESTQDVALKYIYISELIKDRVIIRLLVNELY